MIKVDASLRWIQNKDYEERHEGYRLQINVVRRAVQKADWEICQLFGTVYKQQRTFKYRKGQIKNKRHYWTTIISVLKGTGDRCKQ